MKLIYYKFMAFVVTWLLRLLPRNAPVVYKGIDSSLVMCEQVAILGLRKVLIVTDNFLGDGDDSGEVNLDQYSPMAGMPVLECWKGTTSIVLKRSMATGYAGVQNPLFFLDNTRMLFGDAKESLDEVFKAL